VGRILTSFIDWGKGKAACLMALFIFIVVSILTIRFEKPMGIIMYLAKIKRFLTDTYGISVVEKDGVPTLKEEMDGWKNGIIFMAPYLRIPLGNEFMICHIFGHFVQYYLGQGYNKIKNATDFSKQQYYLYEMEVCAYGKGILDSIGINDGHYLDQYDAFMDADFEYYWHYLTSKKREYAIFYDKYLNNINNSIEQIPALKVPSGFYIVPQLSNVKIKII
jgi:hypothetical protein